MCDTDEESKYKVLQNEIFLKCVTSRSSQVSSSSSNKVLDEVVSISTVIDYLYKNLNDRKHKKFLEDLRKSLIKISPNGQVNWKLFKEGFRSWISSLPKSQDGNNNVQNDGAKKMYRYVSEWHSDDLTRCSSSSSKESKNVRDEFNTPKKNSPDQQSSLPFINTVNVSSYSPDSNSTRCLTDVSADSEIEMGFDAAIDLRLRIRKFDEENANLREEILRFEDLNINLKRENNSLNRRLEVLSFQNKNLQKELDEQKELYYEAEERAKSSKLELQKVLKEKTSLEKELESVQKHDESIGALESQLSQLLQENKNIKKLYEESEKIIEDKFAECDSLKETIIDLENSNVYCRETYESSIQFLREKNTELVNQNLELQIKSNESGSELLPSTPSFNSQNSYMHSTPYEAQNNSPRRNLYVELKACGFSPNSAKNDSKIAELEEELSWYNEEFKSVSEQIKSLIHKLAESSQKPYVPSLNLNNESTQISTLTIIKQDIAILMNLVPERVEKIETRDFSLQVSLEDPKVRGQFSGSIENESLAQSESSMTSVSTETNRESERVSGCSSGAEISKVEEKSSQVQVHESSIIQALDQILLDTVNNDSSFQKPFSTRSHKRRCIYTHTRPPTPNPDLIITPSAESRVSNQDEKSHCVSSKGDAPEKNFPRKSLENLHGSFQFDQDLSTSSAIFRENFPSTSEAMQRDTEEEKKQNIPDTTHCIDSNLNPSLKTVPKRKLSVFHRSFDLDCLAVNHAKAENFLETKNSGKDCAKEANPVHNFPLNTYRSALNSSESSDNASPEKSIFKDVDLSYSKLETPKSRHVILAPTKLILPSTKLIFSEKIPKNEGLDETKNGVSSPVEVNSSNNDNSGAVESGNKIVNKISPSVGNAMSSAEDSSDSECDRINSRNDRQVTVSDSVSFAKSQHKISPENVTNNPAPEESAILEKVKMHRRSLSDSERRKISECQCHINEIMSPLETLDKEKIHPKAFPSLTDDHLQKFGIANFTDLQSEFSEKLPEDELERRYTSFSVGLRTDRMTLSRRLTISQRQRDQAERNLTTEVEKMHQDIQDLAPLCTDRESLERVERVRLQLEMITQCSHRVSCVAETLGAVHQERRVSRATLLADRYLQLLKSRCEKLATEINETKRILMENNIVIEEHPGELGDDIPRIRYRAVSTNNRTMMARRRASIAAISRPLGSQQDLKEGSRQRNSVSGRITLRRPSLNYETHKWENDKLFRTDSSSSIGELREIFEQAESRRNSREENNNIIRNSTNYLIPTNHETTESEIWSHPEEDFHQEPPPIENLALQTIPQSQNYPSNFRTTLRKILLHPVFWYILISFFFGFYVKHVFSSTLCVGTSFTWYSFEELIESYIQVRTKGSRPF